MLKSKIILISLLMLFFLLTLFSGCPKTPFTSNNPTKPVDVEIKYLRKDDNPNCPRTNFDPVVDERVYLNGSGPFNMRDNQMQKIGEDLFFKEVLDVRVNYPYRDYGGDPYEVFILDNAFGNLERRDCNCRAHDLWFNGYPVPQDKIHRIGDKEFVLVRFDANNVPHFF